MENIKKIIGENLSYLRKNSNLTQSELGEKFGYSDKTVSAWEKGTSAPDLETLARLADFYQVDMNFLFSPLSLNKKVNRVTNNGMLSNRQKIMIISFVIVLIFLVATLVFVYLSIYVQDDENSLPLWMTWIWAISLSFVSCAILCAVYWKDAKLPTCAFSSCAIWCGLLSFCLQGYLADLNLWITMIVGFPIQILLIIWLGYGGSHKKAMYRYMYQLYDKESEKKRTID